jgi:hypothetical protein
MGHIAMIIFSGASSQVTALQAFYSQLMSTFGWSSAQPHADPDTHPDVALADTDADSVDGSHRKLRRGLGEQHRLRARQRRLPWWPQLDRQPVVERYGVR